MNKKALNSRPADSLHRVALNYALPADGAAPEWIELLPAGRIVQGRDGRSWVNDQPDGILAYFAADGKDIPVDWEHSSEIKAPEGEPAPAAGWVSDMEAREGGAVWGRVEWTPRGEESVKNREYRYLSPVIIYEKVAGRIKGISSVGLTNRPNLHLNALNSAQQKEEKQMDKELLAALGLPEDATLEQAKNAIAKLKGDLATAANKAETPSLEKFVPRSDYDAAVTRAANAEQKMKDREAAELEKAVNAEIAAALKAGKITPATAEYHKAQCRQVGGLERFREFVKAAPVVAPDSGLDGKAAGETGKALNAEELRIAAMFGNTAEDIKKYAQA